EHVYVGIRQLASMSLLRSTCTPTVLNTHTHSRTHTHTHTHTHSHTHSHTHKLQANKPAKLSNSSFFLPPQLLHTHTQKHTLTQRYTLTQVAQSCSVHCR